MSIEIKIPDIGDDKLSIIELLVTAGDQVEKDDSLMILESDKAAVEVPAPASGVIESLSVKVGDEIATNDLVGYILGAEAPKESLDDSKSTNNSPDNKSPVVNTVERDIVIPDIGDSENVPVIDILVNVGDIVEVESGLVTLESDKASMDVPSEFTGKITSLSIKVGDELNSGDIIGKISIESVDKGNDDTVSKLADTKDKDQPKPESKPNEPSVSVIKNDTTIDEKAFQLAHASPSVRKFARELGANLGLIKGSGRKGRITRDDVVSSIKTILSNGASTTNANNLGTGIPKVAGQDFSKFGPTEEKKLSRINMLTGQHMRMSWLNVPHVTQNDEADITDLEDFRKSLKVEAEKLGVRVTMLSFLMKAVVSGMKELPKFNSSLSEDGQSLIMKGYFNIGIAVDTPSGLVVPVIREVDKKTIYDLSRDLMDISKKAREGKLTPSDLQGGCMTISSLGGIGGGHFTPIVNVPEVAILGVGRSKMQPTWNGKEFIPRNILPLSLSYDHRVIDGADGARFTQYLSKVLSDARRLLL